MSIRAKPWNTTEVEERTTTKDPFEPTAERVDPTAAEQPYEPSEPVIPHEIYSSESPVASHESYERMFNDRKPSMMKDGQNESNLPKKVLVSMLIVGFASLAMYIGVTSMKRKRSAASVTMAIQQLQMNDSSKGGTNRVRTTIVGEGDLEADGSEMGRSNSIPIDKSFVIDDDGENCVSNGSYSANGPEIV